MSCSLQSVASQGFGSARQGRGLLVPGSKRQGARARLVAGPSPPCHKPHGSHITGSPDLAAASDEDPRMAPQAEASTATSVHSKFARSYWPGVTSKMGSLLTAKLRSQVESQQTFFAATLSCPFRKKADTFWFCLPIAPADGSGIGGGPGHGCGRGGGGSTKLCGGKPWHLRQPRTDTSRRETAPMYA